MIVQAEEYWRCFEDSLTAKAGTGLILVRLLL